MNSEEQLRSNSDILWYKNLHNHEMYFENELIRETFQLYQIT